MAITRQQVLDCFRSDDLIGIGMEADAVRRGLHPENVVTYVVDRQVCVTAADLEARLDEAAHVGASGVTLRGTLPTLAAWEALLAGLRSRFPSLWLHGLSSTTVVALAANADLGVDQALGRLKAAGLQSLSGDDAGVLPIHDSGRCTMQDWLAVHRTTHLLGLPSTVAMRFGAGETLEQRIEHLEALDRLQQQTRGFVSFRPVAAALPNIEEATAVEYLTVLAVSRMMLDSIPHIEADWFAQGLKVLQMALRFGANDVGSTLPGETLTTLSGTSEEDLRRVIRGAGFRPVQRDTAYQTLFLG